ncbi:MAG TPA: fused MFS/spermidine synthase, partial [Bacteroidota bacterium]|nr:fused MFS/spermidine synthase [Bacteroidota bacterium]
ACAGSLPPVTVFILRAMRNVVFTAGSMVGILQALCASLVILAPFCVLSGFLFTLFVHIVTPLEEGKSAARVYALESLGAASGGIAFSLALTWYLETFQALFILLLADLAVASLLAWRARAPYAAAGALACAGLAVAALVMNRADGWTRGYLFPEQEIVYFRDTPYGNLTLTRQGEEISFFENCMLMFSTNNATPNEEAVHYCMVQRAAHRRVLLVGGGIAGTPGEILKYGVEGIDYVEINPWIIGVGRTYTRTLDDSRVAVIEADARMFVRSTPHRYDAVIVDLPDPATAQINRFYTLEFFQDLKRVMNDSAVVSISLLPAADYQGTEARGVTSVLYRTLGRVFAHVLIIPGERNYFLASGSPLQSGIARLVEMRGVSTTYVNRYYLDDGRIAARSAEITSALDPHAEVNTDFTPLCYYRQLGYWLSYFGFAPGPWLLTAGFVLLLLLGRFTALGAAIFAGGFAASSLEIVLLVSFQVLAGALFQMTGFVITAFMGGLAAGALLSARSLRRPGIRVLIGAQFALSLVCLAVPAILLLLQSWHSSPFSSGCVITAVAFTGALLTGFEFGTAAQIRRGGAAGSPSELYGLDLFGSALGAVVVSVYAIPLLGLSGASVLAGAFAAGGGILCLMVRKRYAQVGQEL